MHKCSSPIRSSCEPLLSGKINASYSIVTSLGFICRLPFRHHAYRVLESTIVDLESRGSFDLLEVQVDRAIKTLEEERSLEVSWQIWSELVKQLRELLKTDEQNNEDKVERSVDYANALSVQLDNSRFVNTTKLSTSIVIDTKYAKEIVTFESFIVI